MKFIMLTAALMLGGAAVAQTMEDEPAAMSETPTETMPTEPMPAPDATTSVPPPPMTTMPPQMVAPGNTSPETDARGIRVVSDAAMAPAGYNQPAQMVPAGTPMRTVAAATPTSAGPLPPCTRTVTDRCTQTYERGRAK